MSASSPQSTVRTRTEAILDAHDDSWTIGDDQQGCCDCGLTLTSEAHWQEHAQQVIINELRSPTAEILTTPDQLAALPERSVIVSRPGTENTVFRRIVLGDPTMNYWCDLTGTFRSAAALLPAILIERGPTVHAAP